MEESRSTPKVFRLPFPFIYTLRLDLIVAFLSPSAHQLGVLPILSLFKMACLSDLEVIAKHFLKGRDVTITKRYLRPFLAISDM